MLLYKHDLKVSFLSFVPLYAKDVHPQASVLKDSCSSGFTDLVL